MRLARFQSAEGERRPATLKDDDQFTPDSSGTGAEVIVNKRHMVPRQLGVAGITIGPRRHSTASKDPEWDARYLTWPATVSCR